MAMQLEHYKKRMRSIQLFLGLGLVICAQSTPYFILTSTRSKCLSVIAPQGQTLTVSYHAPDMILVDGDESEESPNSAKVNEESKTADEADGQDAEWNRRMKEKLERMKNKKMRDISITVTQKAGLSGALSSRQRKRYNDDEKVTGQGRVREELTKRQGTIEFLTGEEDGTVDICVQSIVANRNSPSRIALNVTTVADDAEEEQSAEVKNDGLDHTAAKNQMSRLERDLQTLNNRARAIMNNADFNKDQQGAFIEQSVSMHSASTYWPIIQVMIIIVTGVTQANHIIRYMRTHHIGI